MLKVNSLYFEYPGLIALDNVSFEIQKNSITALVGPNGAGKTTLMRCIAALTTPFKGTIEINGINTISNPRECHRRIGYLSDFFGLYEDLTVTQCLSHAAMTRGISSSNLNAVVEKTIARMDLEKHSSKKAGELSRGLKQRLAIGQAIVHEPSLVILDEPASGLDPEARHSLAKLFKSLVQLDMTLLISSHILTELDEYSDSMIILHDGKIISHESLDTSTKNTISLSIKILNGGDEDFIKIVEQAGGTIISSNNNNNEHIFSFTNDETKKQDLLKTLITKGYNITSFGQVETNIHEEYIKQVSKSKAGDLDNNSNGGT